MVKTDPAVLSLSTAQKYTPMLKQTSTTKKTTCFFVKKNYLGFNFQRRKDIYA